MADDSKINETIESKHDGRAQVWVQKRQNELKEISDSISKGDYPSVAMMGGMIKKGAGNFGLEKLSEYGGSIEAAAKLKDSQKIKSVLIEYTNYVNRLELSFG
jgi:hypothetical protein